MSAPVEDDAGAAFMKRVGEMISKEINDRSGGTREGTLDVALCVVTGLTVVLGGLVCLSARLAAVNDPADTKRLALAATAEMNGTLREMIDLCAADLAAGRAPGETVQ